MPEPCALSLTRICRLGPTRVARLSELVMRP